jgi:hypothetical protein
VVYLAANGHRDRGGPGSRYNRCDRILFPSLTEYRNRNCAAEEGILGRHQCRAVGIGRLADGCKDRGIGDRP